MGGYEVYLGKTLLPIAPDKISMKINGKNTTYDLINEGEMNILKLAGLTTVSFKILLPAVAYPFANYPDGFKAPSHYLNKLEKLKQNKKPFQFIVTRKDKMKGRKKLHNTNMKVSLEDYTISEDAESEGFDVSVEINLKQYKDRKTKTFKVETPSDTAPVAVQPEREESSSDTDTGKDDQGKGKGQKYKIQIPGMSAVEVYSTSAQGAITKAAGNTWTGTVYVNGEAYTVKNGKITQTPQQRKLVEAGSRIIQTTVDTVKSGLQTLGDALKTAFTSQQKQEVTVTPKPQTGSGTKSEMIYMN